MSDDVLPKPYSWDSCMLEVAFNVSKMSKDPSTKVGSVIVSVDKKRVSFGYNGFPPGFPDRIKWWSERDRYSDDFCKYDLVSHAEDNAISQAKCDVSGWTLYCTHRPCLECAKRIVKEKISRVVFCLDQSAVKMDVNALKVNKFFDMGGVELVNIDKSELQLP